MKHRFCSTRRQQAGRLSTGVVFSVFAAIALFFLLAEHRAHLTGWLPFLLLAACPLLHLFHGHGGHGQRPRPDPAGDSTRPMPPPAGGEQPH